MKESKELVIIGSIGYDIYITGKNKVVIVPGGFAWHCACGVYAAKGKSYVLANYTKSFNNNFLKKFKGSNVKVIKNYSYDTLENAYIFNFKLKDYTVGISYSEGKPGKSFNEILPSKLKENIHFHIGTTDPSTILKRTLDLKRHCPSATFSTNLYFPYLKQNINTVLQIIKYCAMVFLNYSELELVRHMGKLRQISKDKLLVVTCGRVGTILFLNGTCLNFYYTKEEKEVSSIGAGDVFIGSFLASVLQKKNYLKALIIASKAASQSVLSYGTHHIVPLSITRKEMQIEKTHQHNTYFDKIINFKLSDFKQLKKVW